MASRIVDQIFASLGTAGTEQAEGELEALLFGLAAMANDDIRARMFEARTVAPSFLRQCFAVSIDHASNLFRFHLNRMPERRVGAKESVRSVLQIGYALDDAKKALAAAPDNASDAEIDFSSALRPIARAIDVCELELLQLLPSRMKQAQDVPRTLALLNAELPYKQGEFLIRTVLVLLRSERMITAVLRYIEHDASIAMAHVMLAGVHGDLLRLAIELDEPLAHALADEYERALFSVPATDMRDSKGDVMEAEGRQAFLFRQFFGSLAEPLRADVERAFAEGPLPFSDMRNPRASHGPISLACATIAGTCAHILRAIYDEFAPQSAHLAAPTDQEIQIQLSERARRHVWMWRLIVRAAVEKTTNVDGSDRRWEKSYELQSLKDFARHFRSLGVRLLRDHDYEHLGALVAKLRYACELDLYDAARVQELTAECETMIGYLDGLFEQISARTELRALPFDRRAAHASLRIYLQRG